MSTSLDCIDRDVLRSKIAELTGKKVLEMNQIDWYLVFNVRLEDDEHVIVRFAKEDRLNSLPDRMKDYAAILAYLGSPEPNGLNIPVPKIKHVEPNASEVGLPWMLMDMIPGDLVVDTYRSWRRLSVSVREQRIACSIRALAHAYGKIFNAPIPRDLSAIFNEEYQHHHNTPMPAAFDIRLEYPSHDSHLEPVSAEIHHARTARQATATYIAHRFWDLMYDSEWSAESSISTIPDWLPTLHRLKALVPFIIPSIEEYIPSSDYGGGDLGAPKLHHADPSLTNILIDPTGNLTGIIDWEDTTAAPALLSAAYPEWFRYDGEFTALSDWSCRMVKFEPVTYEYGIYRALYEQAVEEVSPEYLKAMRSGRKLRELLDWAEKTMAGRPFDERLAVVNKWASERAIEFGVTLPTVFLTKKDWISVL